MFQQRLYVIFCMFLQLSFSLHLASPRFRSHECRSNEIISRRILHATTVEPMLPEDPTSIFEKDCKAKENVDAPFLTHAYIQSIRGLVALKYIAEGKAVIRVPMQYSITTGLADAGPGRDTIPSAISRGTDRLAVMMLLEDQLGIESKYRSYLKMLPKSSYGPLRWSDELLQSFPYTAIQYSVLKQNQEWEKLFLQINESVSSLKRLNYQKFLWAMEMVASRSFQGSLSVLTPSQRLSCFVTGAVTAFFAVIDLWKHYFSEGDILDISLLGFAVLLSAGPGIVDKSFPVFTLHPFIDSANHKGDAPDGSLQLSSTQDYYEVIARKNVADNKEFCISYGDRHNDDLLQYYGFIEADNIHDRYVIVYAQEKLQQLADGGVISSLKQEDPHLNADIIKSKSIVISRSTNWGDLISRVKQLLPKPLSENEIQRLVIGLLKWEKEDFLSKQREYLDKVATIPDKYRADMSQDCVAEAADPVPLIELFLREKAKVLDYCLQKLS